MVQFDREFKTPKGFVLGVMVLPQSEKAYPCLDKKKKIDINTFHKMLGHPGKETTIKTSKYYGVIVEGNLDPCDACALSKSKQKNVAKKSEVKATRAGERLFMDTSSIKAKSFGGSKFWLLVVDDYTDMCWCFLLKNKSEMCNKMLELVKDLKSKNRKVNYIRCDNAGKNFKTQSLFKEEGMGVDFEFTGPATPQSNGRVERKFATLDA